MSKAPTSRSGMPSSAPAKHATGRGGTSEHRVAQHRAQRWEVVARIESHGAVVETSTPDELRQKVKSELVKWKGVVDYAKLVAD